MHPLLPEFCALFEGHTNSYGTYTMTNEVKDNGKRMGKAASFNKQVTVEMYNDHLMGKIGLGITPINKDSMVKFGAADIDEYPLDLPLLNAKITEAKFPLVLCRTKSGGAHLYMFMKEWAPAALVQKKLREMASALGHGTVEIYPRQSQLLTERGDVGNWINIPYFHEQKTMRYALGPKNTALLFKDFIPYAQSKVIAVSYLETLRCIAPEVLPGGPPCLQQLVKQGFPEGTRNNGLMNMGVYAMKAYGDNWQARLEEFNNKYMHPPLPPEEVLSVIKSLGRKDYSYSCKSQPIQSFCNAAVCRTCKHGVGGADIGMPKFGSLTKIATAPPVWFVDVEVEEGVQRMELSTEELQQPALFQKRCMEALNIMPIVLKRDNWIPIIQKLLLEVVVVEVPVEATPVGVLHNHVEAFCTSRVTARSVDELLLGKPWVNDGIVHFRLQDFIQFITIKKFTLLPLNKIATVLRDFPGYKKGFHNIKGKGVNVYTIPLVSLSKQTESFDSPPQPKELI